MNGATEASLRKALPKGRLSDLGRLIVAARFDQERAALKSWLKDVAPRSCASGSVMMRPSGSSFRSATGKNWAREGLDLLNRTPKHTLTLMYARNEEYNEAVVLKRILEGYKMEDKL